MRENLTDFRFCMNIASMAKVGAGNRGNRKREELSQFLRIRRARLSPTDIGLLPSGSRRTPGLRREEVAVLAGVGTSWYTWLEQGRDINVSEPVAGAIGRALCLDDVERRYLYRLLGMTPSEPVQSPEPRLTELGPLLDQLSPNPAMTTDAFWTITACNPAARTVFGLSGPGENLLLVLFTDPRVRSRIIGFPVLARNLVNRFRAELAGYFDTSRFSELMAELTASSAEFTALWNQHDVVGQCDWGCEIDHPEAGRLRLDTYLWRLSGNEGIRLLLHTPVPCTDTAEKLAGLAARGSRTAAGASHGRVFASRGFTWPCGPVSGG
jgi:hypothetical protein